jgi:hypothetical protein
MVAKMPAGKINDNNHAPERNGLLRPRRQWQTPKLLSIDVASTKEGPPIPRFDSPVTLS